MFKNVEFIIWYGWWCYYYVFGIVVVLCIFCWVIIDLYFVLVKWVQGQCMKVGLDFLIVYYVCLQFVEWEYGCEIVYEFVYQQVLVFVWVVFYVQLVEVEQVIVVVYCIFYGDYLVVLFVCVQQVGGQIVVGQVDVYFVGFVVFMVEQCIGLEWISIVCQVGWCGKIGLLLFFVNSYIGSYFVQFLEFWYLEIFIQIQVVVVILGCVGIGVEEVQCGFVRKYYWIVFQFYFYFFGEVDDVLFKDVGLCFVGGKENLVMFGQQGVNQGFMGKIEGCVDLV